MLQPPKYYHRFFRWFCHADFYEELAGDLEEAFFQNVEKKGQRYARHQYRKEVLQLFRPSVIKELPFNYFNQISLDMLQNYFKIAVRNLGRDKVSAIINILGLCIGFASTFFILLFVYHELHIDTAFENGERIYRITNDERPFSENGRFLATVSPPFAPTLAAAYAEVESAVRLRTTHDVIFKYQDQQHYENKALYVDEDFFKLFSFLFEKGDPTTALAAPNSVVLTPQMAQKYFGDEDPIGKSLLMGENTPLTVTAILKDAPKRTHLNFDFLISFSTFKVPHGYPVTLESWGWISFHTYILLKKGVEPVAFEGKLADFAKQHIYKDRPVRSAFKLQPLSDIYFHSDDMMNTEEYKKGSLAYTYGLLLIAFLILLVAGFNFMNISTARSIKRAKEVGVRKVLGARRHDLIIQFMGEALVVSIISLAIGVFLFELLRHGLFSYLEMDFDFNYADYWMLLPTLLALTFILGILSAVYPAIVLSRFMPLNVLKGILKTSGSELSMRKGLVVLQFAITVGLIVCSLVVARQMDFIRNKNLGYDKEQLVSLKMQTDDFLQKYRLAQTIFEQNPYIVGITAGDVMGGDYGSVPMTPAGAERGIPMTMIGGYFDYFSTMGVQLVQGRDFSSQHPTDTLSGIIINESALQTFGWEDPLGQQLQVNTDINGEIIGVVKDFHFYSLHDPIEPMVTVIPRTYMENIILRIKPIENIEQVVQSLRQDWQQIAPELPFQFSFFDDAIHLQYESDRLFSKLIGFFSWLTIFIAGLGLYGMIAIITTYKVKEIGIRKILGASVLNISVLLSKNFLLLILLSNVLAIPLAWWAMKQWLQNFTYRVEIDATLFIVAILMSLLIALLALSYQVVKSALENPIQALRE